jgi:hypothetical protein
MLYPPVMVSEVTGMVKPKKNGDPKRSRREITAGRKGELNLT